MTTGSAWGTPDGTAPDDATPAWGTPDATGPEQVTLTAGPGFLGPFTAAVYELFYRPVPGKRYLVGLVALSVVVAGVVDGGTLDRGATVVLGLTGLFLVGALVARPFGLGMRGNTWQVTARAVRMDLAWDHTPPRPRIRRLTVPWSIVRRAIVTDQSLSLVTKQGRAYALGLKDVSPADVATVVGWARDAGVEVHTSRG